MKGVDYMGMDFDVNVKVRTPGADKVDELEKKINSLKTESIKVKVDVDKSSLSKLKLNASGLKIKPTVDTSGIKQATKDFQIVKNLATQISQTKIKIAGLDTSKNANEISVLQNQLRKMESDENEDNSDPDMNENGPSIGISSETDGEDNDYEDTPFCDIPDPDEDEDTNKIHTAVRYIVANMSDPCKSIFKYKFFTEDGKRKHDDEIASLTGLKNATTVRSTFQNCKKKFKERFEKILKYLS